MRVQSARSANFELEQLDYAYHHGMLSQEDYERLSNDLMPELYQALYDMSNQQIDNITLQISIRH